MSKQVNSASGYGQTLPVQYGQNRVQVKLSYYWSMQTPVGSQGADQEDLDSLAGLLSRLSETPMPDDPIRLCKRRMFVAQALGLLDKALAE